MNPTDRNGFALAVIQRLGQVGCGVLVGGFGALIGLRAMALLRPGEYVNCSKQWVTKIERFGYLINPAEQLFGRELILGIGVANGV